MATQQDYNNKSLDERIILKEIIKKLYDKTRIDIECYFTDVDSKDIYDGYVMVFAKGTGTIIKRHLIEIKIRDCHYDQLMIEKKKLTNLKNKAAESAAQIVYISCTPNGSYVYNLSRLENEISFEWNKEEHWKTSTDKQQGKVVKTVAYLDTKYSKQVDVKQSDLEVLKRLKNAEEKTLKTCSSSKQKRGLFDIFLFGDKVAKTATVATSIDPTYDINK